MYKILLAFTGKNDNYFVWLTTFNSLFFSSEYIRITDGNGTLVYSRRGYSSSIRQSFLQVDFGRRDSINFQIYLTRSYSRFKLQYGIVKQGLGSGKGIANYFIKAGFLNGL